MLCSKQSTGYIVKKPLVPLIWTGSDIRMLLVGRKIPECLQHLSISVWVQQHSGLREKSFLLSLKVDRKALGFEVASQALAGDFSTSVTMMNSEVESQRTVPVGLIAAVEQFWTESVRKTRYPFLYELLCVR
jgi:hypothetical protein